jgi:hypothetical protein
MGATIFGFLTESFLFEEALMDELFSGVSEQELKKELRAYREYCLAHLLEIEEESASASELRMFSGMERVELELLKQSAFYVEQHVLQDPLFPLTYESGQMNEVMQQYLGFKDTSINRKKLSSILRFLKSLTPMVAANYVKFLPVSYLFEPPQEEIPIIYSPNYLKDILPPVVLDYFHKEAIVESLRATENGWMVENGLRLCRGISVRFKQHYMSEARIYHLLEQEFNELDQKTNTVDFRMHLPDTPPSPDLFNVWVYQSINRAAGDIYERLLSDIRISNRLGSTYLTDSKFIFGLINQVQPTPGSIKTNTVNTLLNMELPFLDSVDIETLMKVRRDDGEAFKNFRVELDSKLKQLRLENDPKRLSVLAANAMHELSEVQLHQITQKLSEIKHRALADAAILSAGLYGGIQTEGWSVIVLGLAIAKGYKTAMEYWEKVKQNPSFFLWRVITK